MRKAINLMRWVTGSIIKEFNSFSPNIKTYVMYGVLYDIMFNLSKPYAAKFAERIGATELHFSLITALPGLFAMIALIPGSIFLTRFENKKNVTAVLFAASRLFLPLLALSPLLPAEHRALVFVILLSAMNFPDALSQASLQSFLGDLFMPRQRGDAIAVRQKFGNGATTTVLIVSCLVLNFAAGTNEEKILVYQGIYLVAFLCGIMEIIVFLRLKPRKNVQPAAVQHFNFKSSFKTIVKDKKFMTYCLVAFSFHFAYFMGFPLSNIVHIKVLHASEFWVGITAIANILPIVISAPYWGRLLAKKGTGVVIALSSVGMAVNTLLMIFSPNAIVFSFFALWGGWFAGGVNIGILSGLLESTPDENRVVYVGVFQTFVNFTLLVAPLVGHLIVINTNITFALGVTVFLRAACGGFIYLIYAESKNKKVC